MDNVYHFIGIGGIGMSALSRILLQRGASVSGSDISSSATIEQLKALGAKVHLGHDASYVRENASIVFSTDIKDDNPELMIAKKRGQKLLHRSHLLRDLFSSQKPLLVTGTHGKTTTSSLLSHVLCALGWQPSFAVGGLLKKGKVNAEHGDGEYFVAEADESDKSFLAYRGYGAIVTNIDLDHLNYWHTEKELVEGFKTFIDSVENKNLVLYCCDDARLRSIGLGVGYGFSEDAKARLSNFSQNGLVLSFDLNFQGNIYKQIKAPLIGKHNALNTASVFALALLLGAKEKELREAIASFHGVARRADKIGEACGTLFYDDYGHHPTEILATLSAFKQSHPDRRLITVFQPHRYTRTRDCFEEFVDAFIDSSVLVLTDLYAASEDPIEGISTEALYRRILEKHPIQTYYIRKDALVDFLSYFAREDDVVLTIGAGDVTKMGPLVLDRMQARV